MSVLPGRLVDGCARAQIYSIMRVRLNVFVARSQVMMGDGEKVAYAEMPGTCAGLLLIAALASAATSTRDGNGQGNAAGQENREVNG